MRSIISALLLVFAIGSPALLAAPIDFTVGVLALDGKAVVECKESETKTVPAKAPGEPDKEETRCKRTGPFTIGEIAAAGLNIPDRNLPVDEQVKRGNLVKLVIDGKAVDLTSAQIALVESQAAKLGIQPFFVTQLVKAIDPNLGK